MLEVDLEYPQELHETHNSYPIAPSDKNVQDELSAYSRGLHSDLYGETHKRPKTTKLIPTLFNLENKTNYIVHYRNLQLYTKLGMKIIKTQNLGISSITIACNLHTIQHDKETTIKECVRKEFLQTDV